MSAGPFESAKYATNDGFIYACSAQPETKGLTLNGVANAYPTDAIDAGLPTLNLRQNRKGNGVKVRTVTVKLTADGTGATSEYKSGTRHQIPIFTASVWDGIVNQQTGTYLGINCEVVYKTPEQIR